MFAKIIRGKLQDTAKCACLNGHTAKMRLN